MNVFIKVNQKTLTEFLHSEEAPPGYVYFINNKPAVQIHFFEDVYTLFWLGSLTVETFLGSFTDIFDEAIKNLSLDNPAPAFTGSISVVKKRENIVESDQTSSSGKIIYSRESKPLIYSPLKPNSFELQDSAKALTGPAVSGTASILVKTKAQDEDRALQLMLWADTVDSPKEEKEVGLTSNLPLPNSVEGLLLKTSHIAKGIPRSECDPLFSLINDNISERGYY